MNKWILVYDAGRTPAIHTTEVEAETMADAVDGRRFSKPSCPARLTLFR